MDKKYLNFDKVSETETELYIYGNIEKKTWIDDWLGTGDDKTDAYTLKDALKMVDTPNLTVRINSRGGLVEEGLAIYSLLSEFKGKVKTIVDGWACSAASVIFMAGEERVVPENGILMIHNAWSSATGDSKVMKKASEDLEKITQPSINIYVKKTGLSEETIKEMMDRTEWITSKEAYELGFSTTQTRKSEAMQYVESDFVFELVMKNKELQNSIEEKAKEMAKQIVQEMSKGSAKDNPTGLYNEIELQHGKEDAWTSFFNAKK